MVDALFLLLLAAYILAGVPLAPFHADEATQIAMSRDYAFQFLARDPDAIRYREEPARPDLQYLRIINGSIARYTIGLAWHAAGFTPADLNEQWDWGADRDYNVSTGHAPSAALLLASRWPSALFLAASVVALFAIARAVGGRAVAYAASLYYALNPAVLLNGRRAMMEGSALLFGLAIVLAGIWFLRRRSWPAALALGASGGLALAAKHNNLLPVGAVFGVCLLAVVVRACAATARRQAAARLGVAVLAAAAVFVVLNPVWWGADPVVLGLRLADLRGDLLEEQVAVYGGYEGALARAEGFARQVLLALPQYYEDARFGPWLADEIAVYEASPWRGVSLGGTWPGALLMAGLVLAGAVSFLRARDVAPALRGLIGAWAASLLVLTLGLTPLEWQRYYLPAYPAVGLFAALGLVWLIRLVRSPRGG